MREKIHVRITPTHPDRSSFGAYYRGLTDDLQQALETKKFITVERADGTEYWLNLSSVHIVREMTGDPEAD